jgi:uncharacterized 2Fe-2S/4Fe-4S cluster protein (DUF4445 family)
MSYIIIFQPLDRRGECDKGKSLLDCAHRAGVVIASVCGGEGWCGSCKVQVVKGDVSNPTPNEINRFSKQDLKNGWRLACQTFPHGDSTVYVPAESMTTLQRLQLEGLKITIKPKPVVTAHKVQISGPTLSDLQADAERLLNALRQQHRINCQNLDIEVLRELSPQLREWGWQARVSVREGEVVAVNPKSSRHLGLAVDLGSTKIAAYLVDLENGQTLAARGLMNPQISYGDDIISRIAHVINTPSHSRQLQELAVDALNMVMEELYTEVGATREEVIEGVVVGNTAMHHLLLRLPVKQLATSPYVPAIRGALDIKSRNLGLCMARGAYVHFLPNIAGFVGSDHVAMLLATEVWKTKGLAVAIDIGTNTEISLIDDGEVTSVSCASGPAFEGGHIKDGMRASSGAIERMRVRDDQVQYKTIEDAPPVGICGSGILDATAQLYLAGIVDGSGRMKDGHPRVRSEEGRREFVLVDEDTRGNNPAIVFTQHDVREVQKAKAAIRTGIQVLLEARGRSEEEIDQVIIAGAFGSYIDIGSAVAVGMLPALPMSRFHQVGNAAGTGAKLALISRKKRTEAKSLASQVNYIELAAAPGFTKTYVLATALGKYRIIQGEKKEVS